MESQILNDDCTNDASSINCPICLANLNGNQDIGVPDTCEHMFCFECINEWSKNVNTCPYDRKQFNKIQIKKLNGRVFKEIKVENNSKIESHDLVEIELTYCEVCGESDREDRLLLCDSCDNGYHCECLNPPLHNIPMGLWFCPNCSPLSNQSNTNTLITTTTILMFSSLPQSTTHRQIPRTRFVERVRNRINYMRNSSCVTREDVNRAQIQQINEQRRKRKIVRKSSSRGIKKRRIAKTRKSIKKVFSSSQKRILNRFQSKQTNNTLSTLNSNTINTGRRFQLVSGNSDLELEDYTTLKPCCSKSLNNSRSTTNIESTDSTSHNCNNNNNNNNNNSSSDVFNTILNKQRGLLLNWSKTSVQVKRDGSLLVDNSNNNDTLSTIHSKESKKMSKREYDPFNPSTSDSDDQDKIKCNSTQKSSLKSHENYKRQEDRYRVRRRSHSRTRSKDRHKKRSRSRSHDTRDSNKQETKTSITIKKESQTVEIVKKEIENVIPKVESVELNIKNEPKQNLSNGNDAYEPDSDLLCNEVKIEPNKIQESKEPKLQNIEKKTLDCKDKVRLLESIKEIAKETIKPYFLSQKINKDDYKTIMKKVVEKSMNYAKTCELKKEKVTKLVIDYVHKVQMEKKMHPTLS